MTDLFGDTCPCCGQPVQGQRDTPFENFWSQVPKKNGARVYKVGIEQARKAWGKLSAGEQLLASDNVRAFYAWFDKTYPTASPLHPSTYLSQKRWQDEGIKRTEKMAQDTLKYWADQINGDSKLWKKPTTETIVMLLDCGMVTREKLIERGF